MCVRLDLRIAMKASAHLIIDIRNDPMLGELTEQRFRSVDIVVRIDEDVINPQHTVMRDPLNRAESLIAHRDHRGDLMQGLGLP